jgi:cytochrome c oxidase subunit 3
MNKQFHPFHIISPSPWPILSGFLAINSLIRIIILAQTKTSNFLQINLLITTITIFLWWRDVSRESSLQGYHRLKVIRGLRTGILLFIRSEILFFVSFFWIFFHRSLAPNIEIGRIWPPIGILPINPFQIPLLNTIILLSSGITVTWAHHSLITNKNEKVKFSLLITIILGLYFTSLQIWEYWDASFNFSDSIFGSSFFIATGFHGIHVLVGTIFLLISFFRFKINLFSKTHHLGFEMSIWYWHFVDVVWLFLYTFLYWWSYFIISIKNIIDFQSKDLKT